MARGFFARLLRRYEPVSGLGALLEHAGQRVEVEGFADALQPLQDPFSGEACVAIDYRAWPPSTTIGIDGATAHNGRAYQLMVRQAVDFALAEGAISVLVRVDAGEDIAQVHRRLLARFGVGLRAETDVIVTGARVRVAGSVQRLEQVGSPHRTSPHAIALNADRVRLVE